MEPIQAKLSIVADKLHLKNFTEDLNLEEHFVCVADVNRPALQLNGFYEHFEADRIQMIGMVEHAYMNNKTAEERAEIYRKLLSYQKTEVIYEMTYHFAHRFLAKGDRTIDQMVQAARSGKQNIIEGCAASATSSKTELKLVNVAKASLQELLEDYIDYLRTRGHRQWEEGSIEYETMRRLGRDHNDASYFLALCQTRGADVIANMAIILIHQADYLLHRQLERLEADFVKNGGFSERMMRVRKQERGY